MLIIQGVVGETASLLVRQEVTVAADVRVLETVTSTHTFFRIDIDSIIFSYGVFCFTFQVITSASSIGFQDFFTVVVGIQLVVVLYEVQAKVLS